MPESTGCVPAVEEVNRLLRSIQTSAPDADDAREKLYKHFKHVIHSLAYRRRVPELFEDLLQEGCVALFEAANKFDLQRDVLFSTYFTACLRNRLNSFLASEFGHIKNKYRQRVYPGDLTSSGPEDGDLTLEDLTDDGFSEKDVVERINILQFQPRLGPGLARIPDRQREALYLYYWQELSPSGVAASLEVSRPRATALLQKGVANLRLQVLKAAA